MIYFFYAESEVISMHETENANEGDPLIFQYNIQNASLFIDRQDGPFESDSTYK